MVAAKISELQEEIRLTKDAFSSGKDIELEELEFAVEAAMMLAVTDAERVGSLQLEVLYSCNARSRLFGISGEKIVAMEPLQLAQAKCVLYGTYRPFFADPVLGRMLDELLNRLGGQPD